LVTGLDANIATATAANAVNNNLIPMLIAVGYVAYVAYDVYDTYKEEGLDAAVLKLGFEVGTGIVGGVVLKNAYKLGKIVAPTAEAAWIAYMEAHPGVAMVMNKLMGKLTPTITKVTEKVSAGVNKVADKMATGVKEVNDAARNLLSKGKDKVGKPGKPRNAGSDAVKEKGLSIADASKQPPNTTTPKVRNAEDPKNRVAHEYQKVEYRQQMARPYVQDKKLAATLKEIHRDSGTIGNGSTAAAVRTEISTGLPVKGKFHIQKAEDNIIRLQKWINDNPSARPGDRAAAENVLKDLLNALGRD
jgi:hypothetical protein